MTSRRPPGADTSGKWVFQGTPEAYETYLVPLLSMWTPALLARVSLDPGARVLDVACGTGTVARMVAQRPGQTGRVVGLDIDEGMLRVARQIAERSGFGIEWHRGDASAMPFEDSCFDGVFCQQGLQFFPDPRVAIREMHRVLAPGGWLALAALRPIELSPGYAVLAEVLERHAGAAPAAAMRTPFSFGSHVLVRQLLAGAPFHDIKIRIEIRAARFPSAEEMLRAEMVSWLGGVTARLDAARRAALIADLALGLEAHMDDEGVTFPMEALCVTARRQD